MTEAVLEAELDPPRPVRRRHRGRGQRILIFSVPAVVWYLVFTIGPLVAMFVISLYDWRSLAAIPHFSGLGNYVRMATNGELGPAFRNTAVHLIVTLPIVMIASFAIGYYLNLRRPGHRVLRVLMFAPALISLSALGTLFTGVFGTKGLINGALQSVGLDALTRAWLGDPSTALACIIVVNIWAGIGFYAVLFAARLAAIPEEIFDAAELDGAGHWHKMWRIAFPVVMDYFGVLTMLQYLGILFGSAGLVLLLTGGGPGTSTTTLSWVVYHAAFITNKVGYSQSVGVLLFVLGIGGLLIIRRIFRQRY